MATILSTEFRHDLLETEATAKVTSLLQGNLIDLIDLTLMLKQAHWNVVGTNFRSVHLQLDEIIATTRDASDEVAERIAALGVAPDGRSQSIAQESRIASYPLDFIDVSETVERTADALKEAINSLRESIRQLGSLDPVSEDMVIGITGPLEKHLWMLQAQERGSRK